MNIYDYRKRFNELQTEKKLLKKQYKQKNTEIKNQKTEYKNLFDAQQVIQDQVQETQSRLKIHISDIVNLALDAIPFSKRPDYFDLDFIIKRNQTECDLYVVDNNKKMKLPFSVGGGVNDIISFGLQIACWSLQKGEKSNTIILDEPFKNINDPDNILNLKNYVSQMIKMISEKLNIQFIIVGSNSDFKDIGDKVFQMSLDEKNNSVVNVVKS